MGLSNISSNVDKTWTINEQVKEELALNEELKSEINALESSIANEKKLSTILANSTPHQVARLLEGYKDTPWSEIKKDHGRQTLIQVALSHLWNDYSDIVWVVDWYYGKKTKAAIEKFQRDNWLQDVDWLAWPETTTELYNQLMTRDHFQDYETPIDIESTNYWNNISYVARWRDTNLVDITFANFDDSDMQNFSNKTLTYKLSEDEEGNIGFTYNGDEWEAPNIQLEGDTIVVQTKAKTKKNLDKQKTSETMSKYEKQIKEFNATVNKFEWSANISQQTREDLFVATGWIKKNDSTYLNWRDKDHKKWMEEFLQKHTEKADQVVGVALGLYTAMNTGVSLIGTFEDSITHLLTYASDKKLLQSVVKSFWVQDNKTLLAYIADEAQSYEQDRAKECLMLFLENNETQAYAKETLLNELKKRWFWLTWDKDFQSTYGLEYESYKTPTGRHETNAA